MKHLALISLALILSAGVFAQAKYQAKVVVLFYGEKNATFDESKFPNCNFYYTPGITAEVKEIKGASNRMLGAAGIKKEGTAYDINFSGTPTEAYSVHMAGGYFFDKNGAICGNYRDMDNIILSPKKNLQGVYERTNYKSFSKDFIKKGKTVKKAKKDPKKPKTLFDYHRLEMPNDFEVVDAEGKKFSIKDIVKGEPLTLMYVLYIKPDYDFKAGMESGENKTGKQFINDAINTNSGIKKLAPIMDIEEGIFGNKVVW
jgi:hypothetical protein